MGKHILMRYDSELARGLITGNYQTANPVLRMLSLVTNKLRRELDAERKQWMIAQNQGFIPLTSVDAFQIQFQHINAHRNLDLGNNWVDACAKEGAEGFTNDNPRPPFGKTIQQRLQELVPGIAQRREAISEIQPSPVIQDFPAEEEPFVSNLLDDFGNYMEDIPYGSPEDL